MQSKWCDTIWHWQIQRLEILWSLLARSTVRIMHASHRETYAYACTVLIRLQIRSLASSPPSPSPAGLSPSLVRVSVPSMRCSRCPCRCRRSVGMTESKAGVGRAWLGCVEAYTRVGLAGRPAGAGAFHRATAICVVPGEDKSNVLFSGVLKMVDS